MLIHIGLASNKPKSLVRRDELIAMHALSQDRQHEIIDDPEAAELVVLAGDLESFQEARTNRLIKLYPHKVFAYSEIDALVPYIPGVYGSACTPRFIDLRRTQSSMYLSRYCSSNNPEINFRYGVPKELLFSFRGRRDCAVRANILDHSYGRSDIEIFETMGYMHWQNKLVGRKQAQKEYADMLARSHFALCPRGMGFGSIRLFEVMEMGVAPVLLADRYALPPGPDWSSFLLRVPERDFMGLPALLETRVDESSERGRKARLAWETFFAPEVIFNNVVKQWLVIRKHRRISENLYRLSWPLVYFQVHWRECLSEIRSRFPAADKH